MNNAEEPDTREADSHERPVHPLHDQLIALGSKLDAALTQLVQLISEQRPIRRGRSA